ncbi:MAG TPA: beta-L-arabinofuranosidase domain-containing protein [Patescibacteria group bacterium]|nr:beta-L-arabinofuranosidase domain-containing protein [Patescibacteria group bacterium]
MNTKKNLLGVALALAALQTPAITMVPDKIAPVITDKQDSQRPDRVRLEGWIGTRVDANEANRLVKLDPARLLEGYRKRPGRQAWDGEHVGKWLHAATLAWANTADPALREKLDYVAAELVKCQMEDGYLGTYLEKDRWTEWDVWAHKYNLIGLITYMRYTGNLAPLPACRRMGDLLCNTFGDEGGKRDILKAGWHVGLAPTSVLEPMVLLYRLTGEPRYLDFCKYILRAWEHPDGPKVISTLLTLKRVDKVGNGKAYEMLSCLNGALEYYRTVGDEKILQACLNAWQDIVDNRLYITGAASYGELFHDNYDLPNVNNVGETCVTVTWLQFNAQLLRLTGEARFAEQLEHVVLNQLFGAQRCDGSAWGYYVQMEGKKPYSSTLDGHCCLSSGPRGVALIPTFACTTDAEGVVVNLYNGCKATLTLKDQVQLNLASDTLYPGSGQVRIHIDPTRKTAFSVKLRMPAWCKSASVAVNGKKIKCECQSDGYMHIHRTWKKSDRIDLALKLEPRIMIGDHKNEGKVALMYGPLVLTADQALLDQPEERRPAIPLKALALESSDLTALNVTPEPAPATVRSWSGAQVFRINATARAQVGSLAAGSPIHVRLIPFADAGGTGTDYKVWLPLRGSKVAGNLLLQGHETRSRTGNQNGSINDDDLHSVVVTFDGKPAEADWFGVDLDQPVTISRVVFAHGTTFHDGGWFDSSGGKPRIEVRQVSNGAWETVGEFTSYPETTGSSPAGLRSGQEFSCTLKAPVQACAIRVIGKPACGDNAQQAFSSCAELQAFSR